MELRHLSLPLRCPLLRKRQKDKEIMKMQYLFHSVHGDDKIPPNADLWITIVGGGVFIERPRYILICSFLHDVNKKRTLRNLCGVGSRDWFVHNICIPVQCNCNSDGFHLVLSRCKMSLMLFWCDEIMMMSMKVQLRSQLSLSLTRCPSKREPWERDWWRVEDSSVTNFIEMSHHQ